MLSFFPDFLPYSVGIEIYPSYAHDEKQHLHGFVFLSYRTNQIPKTKPYRITIGRLQACLIHIFITITQIELDLSPVTLQGLTDCIVNRRCVVLSESYIWQS